MRFEINSDRGRVGPVVWYNQLQYGLYDYVESRDGRFEVGPLVGITEGLGTTYLWDWCVDLRPLSVWQDVVYLWERFSGKAVSWSDGAVDEWDPGLGSYVDGYRDDEDG